MNLSIAPAAQLELVEAATWYEDRQAGLGTAFLHAVATAFERIAADPRLHPRLEYWTAEWDVRRHCLRQYPYVLIFWNRGDSVVIVAVSHGRRQPMYWIDRLVAPE